MARVKQKMFLFLCLLVILYIFLCHFYRPLLDDKFLELNKCPACYGKKLCKHLFNTEVVLNEHKLNIISVFNVRNVFLGNIANEKVVFKKLAHNWELQRFDSLLGAATLRIVCPLGDCLPQHHAPGDGLREVLKFYDWNVSSLVQNEPELFEFSDAVKCPSVRTIEFLFKSFQEHEATSGSDELLENFVTQLSINPEPLIMMAFRAKEPVFAEVLGACGRLVAYAHAGVPLTDVLDRPWLERVRYALQLLQITQALSTGPMALYLCDPRPENFAVDDRGKVWIVDAENIILVDSKANGMAQDEHENDGTGCLDCFSFSQEDLCSHATTDHNYFAICKSLLSSTPFERSIPGGLLRDAPTWLTEDFPSVFLLIEICSYPAYSPYRKLSGNILTFDTKSGARVPSWGVNTPAKMEECEGNVSSQGQKECGSHNVSLGSPNFATMGRRKAVEYLISIFNKLLNMKLPGKF